MCNLGITDTRAKLTTYVRSGLLTSGAGSAIPQLGDDSDGKKR